jgi:pilus assembly protein CpaC
VITVTPRLAKPMAPEDVRLPTDDFVPPSDAQFFLMGKLEDTRRGDDTQQTTGVEVANGTEATFGHQLD